MMKSRSEETQIRIWEVKTVKYKCIRYLRYALQGAVFGLFIFLFVNLNYPLGWQSAVLQWFSRLDPWLLISQLRWQHSIPIWGWLPLVTIAITPLLGRAFCGWLCPLGALLTLVHKISQLIFKNRLFKKVASVRKKVMHRLLPLRYFWLLFLAVIFLLGFKWVTFLTPFALFSHEILRVLQGTVPWLLMGIVISTLFFSRLWCSVLCPTGLLLSLLGKLRLFSYQVSDNCAQCGKCVQNCSVGAAKAGKGAMKDGCMTCGECRSICPAKTIKWVRMPFHSLKGKNEPQPKVTEANNQYSRRQFLKITFTMALASTGILWGKTVQVAKKVLRPPGALNEPSFTSVCNRCGRCMKVCPNNALQPMPITEGIECFETPYIIPRKANCSLCMSCQEVCPTGAIAKVQAEQVKMGNAVIEKQRCLAWNEGKLCFICGEQCPLVAIEGDAQHRPTVLVDKCVGCGTCEKACPVSGEAAIRILPK